jgi:hypothetical protein
MPFPATSAPALVPLRSERPNLRSAREQFLGTWKLLSWKIRRANGALTDSPLGPKAVGRIMYDAGGHISVALMRPDRPSFVSDHLSEATPEEVKNGFEGYIGYCGSYEVDEKERVVIHRLELSWLPNWVGTEQKRHFEFAGDRLTLRTPPQAVWGEAEVHSLVWQRL